MLLSPIKTTFVIESLNPNIEIESLHTQHILLKNSAKSTQKKYFADHIVSSCVVNATNINLNPSKKATELFLESEWFTDEFNTIIPDLLNGINISLFTCGLGSVSPASHIFGQLSNALEQIFKLDCYVVFAYLGVTDKKCVNLFTMNHVSSEQIATEKYFKSVNSVKEIQDILNIQYTLPTIALMKLQKRGDNINTASTLLLADLKEPHFCEKKISTSINLPSTLQNISMIVNSIAKSGSIGELNYESSFLGYFLKDAIGGNSKSHMFVSLDAANNVSFSELSGFLDFCDNLRRVRNRVYQNIIDPKILKMENKYMQLRGESEESNKTIEKLQHDLNRVKEMHNSVLDEIEKETEASKKKLFADFKIKMESIYKEHDLEIAQVKEEMEARIIEIRESNELMKEKIVNENRTSSLFKEAELCRLKMEVVNGNAQIERNVLFLDLSSHSKCRLEWELDDAKVRIARTNYKELELDKSIQNSKNLELIEEFKAEIEGLKERHEFISTEISELRNENKGIHKSLNELIKKYGSSDDNLESESIISKISILRNAIEKLQANNNEHAKSNKELKKLESEIKTRDKSHAIMEEKMGEISTENTKLKLELDILKNGQSFTASRVEQTLERLEKQILSQKGSKLQPTSADSDDSSEPLKNCKIKKTNKKSKKGEEYNIQDAEESHREPKKSPAKNPEAAEIEEDNEDDKNASDTESLPDVSRKSNKKKRQTKKTLKNSVDEEKSLEKAREEKETLEETGTTKVTRKKSKKFKPEENEAENDGSNSVPSKRAYVHKEVSSSSTLAAENNDKAKDTTSKRFKAASENTEAPKSAVGLKGLLGRIAKTPSTILKDTATNVPKIPKAYEDKRRRNMLETAEEDD